MLSFELGLEEAFGAAFEEAASIERAAGWPIGAQHTVHQWPLLAAPGGSSARAGRTSKESLGNLRAASNSHGAGLCLRSIGELAAVAGRSRECSTFWRSAAKMLARASAPEAEQIRVWLEVLGPPRADPTGLPGASDD